MGLSSGKQTTKQDASVAPNAAYASYINGAADLLKPAYESAVSNNATLMPRVNSALDYYGTTLSGSRLNGNPYLQKVIDSTNADVTNSVTGRFSSAGRYGSTAYVGALAKALSDNENRLRYGDYATERQYQDQAARGVLAGSSVSAALPQAASSAYADAVRSLLGQYTNQTGTNVTKSSPSLLSILAQAASAAGSVAGAF